LHERLANALLSAQPLEPEDEVEAGWHLMLSGAEKRGAARLAAAAPRLAYRSDATSAALPAIEAALRVYEKHDRSPAERLPLRMILVGSLDRALCQKYGDSTLDQLAKYAGLDTARSVRPAVGNWLALRVGVVGAGLRQIVAPRERRAPPPTELIRGIYICSQALLQMYGAILDVEGTRRIVAITGVLATGSITSQVVHLYASGTLAGMQGRYHEACMRLARARAILDEHPSLPHADAATHRGFHVAVRVVQGVLDAHYSVSGKRTETMIAELEELANVDPSTPTPDGIPIEALITNVQVRGLVAQLRLVLYTLRGEQSQAQVHRERFALLGLQTGLSWVYDIWRTLLESVAGARSGDVTALRRAIEQLRQAVPDVPNLEKYLLLDEGYLELTLGRADEARAIFERCREQFPLGEIVGWDNTRNSLGLALIALGEHERACEVIEEALPYTGAAEEPTVVRVLMECTLATARAHLGHHAEAMQRIDELLQRIAHADHPMLLGQVHETAAQIAELAGNEERRGAHLAAMQQWWGKTHNPALLTRAQRAQQRSQTSDRPSAVDPPDIEVATRVSTLRSARGVVAILEACANDEERARSALQMIAEEAAGSSGYLFRWSRGELRLLASLGAGTPQDALERAIRRQIRGSLGDSMQMESAPEVALTNVDGGAVDGEQQYATMLLTRSVDGKPKVVAAVALRMGSIPLRPPSAPQLQSIAEALDDGSPAGSIPPPTLPPAPS
jgi:tetratricopeptide (TPR) repeat protein